MAATNTRFRSMLAGVALAALATPAIAQQCIPASQQASFSAYALQNYLMVMAITCDRQDDYNRFVTQHRALLGGVERDLRNHFSRHGGARAHDLFKTNAANGNSQANLRQGNLFCGNTGQAFPTVLPMTTRDQMAQYAQTNRIGADFVPPVCAGSTATPAATQRPQGQQQRPQGQQPQGQQQPRPQGQPAQPRPASQPAQPRPAQPAATPRS
jgi:hypothetical protein